MSHDVARGVSALSVVGLIRFDVEDYLTPEADWALREVLAGMDRVGLPASYAVVGKKAMALADRGETGSIERLRRAQALGFHSTSHSEHPTIAEELAAVDYRTGVRRFVEREAVGVQMVRSVIGAPRFFTQPGGNWVPDAVDALPDLDMSVFFSDAWNSYVIASSRPLWYGRIVHLSPPVMTPRPFLLGMPDNLGEAVDLLDALPGTLADNDIFMLMMHPTELISTKFWDAVNFSHGSTSHQLRPAPLRSQADREQAVEAFNMYLDHLTGIGGVEWLDVMTLYRRIRPLAPVSVDTGLVVREVERHGLTPLSLSADSLSAAQLLWALCWSCEHRQDSVVEVPVIDAPANWEPDLAPQSGTLSARGVDQAARWLVDDVARTGRLPAKAGPGADAPSLERLAGFVLSRLLDPDRTAVSCRPVSLGFLDYIRQPDQLHWNWPIFPPDFRPFRLWQDARRLAWTVKPAYWKDGQ